MFGSVTDGMDVVDAIAALPLKGEKPVEDAVIDGVTINEG
ncbi:MAG: peptidylprolyl isomerase [Acidimicrobiia bacterium]